MGPDKIWWPGIDLRTPWKNFLSEALPINQRSQFTHLASASAVFCLCTQKASAMRKKSGIFKPLRIQLSVAVASVQIFLQYDSPSIYTQ